MFLSQRKEVKAISKGFLSILLASNLATVSTPSRSFANQVDLPNFTDVVRVLQAQQVEGGTVLAWNHMAADSLGLKTAPGRVGDAAFEKSVFDLVGVTIKSDTPIAKGTNDSMIQTVQKWTDEAAKSGKKLRVLEVEMDAHGGAGRAAYLKVPTADGGETRVNIKGIGVTGDGNARDKKRGPPLGKWTDHSDGGAMLAEGLREYINGIMSHNELKFGGSRVIGVLSINQDIKLSGGEMDSLVIIVREPWRRMDRALDSKDYKEFNRIPWALGQANAKRIMKGDFVNQSNMGFDGGFIDYGLIAFVNGFVPAENYLKVQMHDEMDYLFENNKRALNVYRYAKGFYLLNQLGFEEPRIQKMVDGNPKAVEQLVLLADWFRELIRGENAPTRIDFDKWSKSEVAGNFRAQELFRSLLADMLMHEDRASLVDKIVAKGAQFVAQPSAKFQKNMREFAASLAGAVDMVVAAEPIADKAKFAEAIRRVAEFKNRDLWELSKQPMWEQLSKIGSDFRANRKQTDVQKALDEILSRNQIGTGHHTTTEMSVTADARSAYIHIPARRLADGRHGLRLYTELPSVSALENYRFEISFDGGKTKSVLEGKLVESASGLYYRIEVPHGQFPVTTAPVTLKSAFATASPIIIKGPPMFLNERLGLMSDLNQVPSAMRSKYGLRVNTRDEDFKRVPKARPGSCKQLFGAAG